MVVAVITNLALEERRKKEGRKKREAAVKTFRSELPIGLNMSGVLKTTAPARPSTPPPEPQPDQPIPPTLPDYIAIDE